MNHIDNNQNSLFCLNQAHAEALAEGPGNPHQINQDEGIYLPDDPAAEARGAAILAIEVKAETEAHRFTRRMVAIAETMCGELEPILSAANYLAAKAAVKADRLRDEPRLGGAALIQAIAADAAADAVHANYLSRESAPAPGVSSMVVAAAPGEPRMSAAVQLLKVLEAEAVADTRIYEQAFTTHYIQAARRHYGLAANYSR